MQNKICRSCKIEKELSEFPKKNSNKDGFNNTCKKCCSDKSREYYSKLENYKNKRRERTALKKQDASWVEKNKLRQKELRLKKKEENPEKYKQYLADKKKYREENKQKYMFLSSRSRARYANIPYNLTEDDIIIPEYCPILGMKLEFVERNNNLNSPSIDKIIPELGYVKGNVRVISRKANMMKLNCNFEELKTFSKNILKYIEDYENK
jgi:hypothetical protein